MTTASLARLSLALAATVMVVAGGLHAAAYGQAAAALDGSGLPPFLAAACKALWLTNSTGLFSLAAFYFYAASRISGAAGGPAILLTSLAPLAAAIVLYGQLGIFFAANLMLAAWMLATAAGLFMVRTGEGHGSGAE